MGRRKINLKGNRIGRLIVLHSTGEKSGGNRNIKWLCVCDCGRKVLVRGDHLRAKKTKSCGCLWEEQRKYEEGMGKNYADRLDTWYIKGLIKKRDTINPPFKSIYITEEMVELKRAQILLYREIKLLRKEIKDGIT